MAVDDANSGQTPRYNWGRRGFVALRQRFRITISQLIPAEFDLLIEFTQDVEGLVARGNQAN